MLIKTNKKDLCSILICGVISFFLINHISNSTSLFGLGYFGADSAIFQSIAKSWTEGVIPYRDYFDHKGPILYLINLIAYIFPYHRVALVVIQTGLMALTLFIMWKILTYYWNYKLSLFCISSLILYWAMVYDEGNLSEEYSIPLVVLPLLFQIKYIDLFYKSEKKEHDPKEAFLYGLCFGGITFLRINNALVLCVMVLTITLILIKNRLWKNLLWNMGAFSIGFLCVIIPFVIYFGANNALYDLWQSVFLFNFKYMSSSSYSQSGSLFVIDNIVRFFPIIFMFRSLVISVFNKKWWLVFICALVSFVQGFFLVDSAQYTHYYMVLVPVFLLAYAVIGINKKDESERKDFCSLGGQAVTLFCLLCVVLIKPHWIKTNLQFNDVRYAYNGCIKELVSEIAPDEYESVMTYNLSNTDAAIYLVTDIRPIHRNCTLTEFQCNIDPNMMDDYLSFWKNNNNIKWVLTAQNVFENLEVNQIMESEYYLYDQKSYDVGWETRTFYLYHKK